MCKDFFVDPFQVHLSKSYGADAILIIIAGVNDNLADKLYEEALNLNMSVIVEVHTIDEAKKALRFNEALIGINNRNLETFIVDLQVTEKLASLIPENKVIVSESGIRTRADIDYLAKHGVHAVLVGEALVSSEDPAMVLRSLL